MLLHRYDDAGWRALARSSGISEHIARLLWSRAEASANHDPRKAERAFRRMLEDAKTLDALALALEADNRIASDAGKWTRVLVEEHRAPGGAAEQASHESSMSPATRLRHALETAIERGESVARTIAGANAKTITDALRRLGREPGSALAAIDGDALAQLLRLADALVTLVEQGRRAGQALPATLRDELESRIEADLGDVRVHDDAAAAAEASRHDAVAFAQGRDVVFAGGMYDPSSAAGKQLIAHEVVHVVQQRRGSRAPSGAMSEPGSAVEREADRVASAFAAGAAPGAPELVVRERAAAGTISRKATSEPASGPAAGPGEWKPTLLGQTLDLSARLAGARDVGDGCKQIDVNQSIGPLRIHHARFKASGDKVESGTLVASVESGSLKGSTGSLAVNASGQVSGALTVPIDVPGLLVKQISVEVGAGRITGKARLVPRDFVGPDVPIQTSDFELTVTSTGSSVEIGLTGSAEVAIDNGMAQGQAKMEVDLRVGQEVSFSATITGKIAIVGLAGADAVIKYDGKNLELAVGGIVPVDLPGLEGTANIRFARGKLSLDSRDLHFTLPQLAPIKFREVRASRGKLAAELHLDAPVHVPLPGDASLTLEQSSIAIDGSKVSGDITGAFALGNAGGLTGRVQLAYQRGGDIAGSISIAGGAKFTVGGVEVTIERGSRLDVANGMGVSGEVAGQVKVPGLPEIGVHVVAKRGEPIDLTCDARIPLQKLVPQLGGDLHVTYHRGAGASAFSLDATDVAVLAPPINGQVIFSKLSARLQGRQLTGLLTAAPGTAIKAGGMTVTIVGGTIQLLPGRILDGQLQLRSDAGDTGVQGTVGWKQGHFDWAAEGNFDLGPMTRGRLIGTVRAAAGSDGTGNFASSGPITFGSPALRGVEISHLSGNKKDRTFLATVSATQAVNKVLEDVPGVHVATHATTATVTYRDGELGLEGSVSGKARYPRTGPSRLEGNFCLGFHSKTGFTGKIEHVKLQASDHFKSHDGTADLETGKVNLGKATFSVPGILEGKDVTANINVKTGTFHVEANVDTTVPALRGVKLRVTLDNDHVKATLRENAPPIPVGKLATLTVGGDSTVHLDRGGLSAHLAGSVDATGLGKGRFKIDYVKGHLTGNAQVDVDPFAMFDAVTLDMRLDANRKLSTERPIELRLASRYTSMFAAAAQVSVTENKFHVRGRVTELKNLGKISEAFNQRGATITYDQSSRQVTMSAEFDIGGKVIPELATGSTLRFAYQQNVFAIEGTLRPRSYGPVAFRPDSHLTASWSSASSRFVVTGEAHAEIAKLCTAEFTVDAGVGGGEPGAFALKGRLDPTRLAQRIPGITFSRVTADFSVLIGQGTQSDLNFHLDARISGIPAAGVHDISAHISADYRNGEGISGELAVTRARLGEVIADGKIQIERNKLRSGSLHLLADFKKLTIEGTGEVAAGEMGELKTSADLTVTPSAGSPISRFVQSGNIHVELAKWKLTGAVGQLHLVPPSFLPIEKPVVEIGYRPEHGIHATLTTQFDAPMAKNGEKGTFVAGYDRDRGLHAHVEFPITVPGFQAATVSGDLDARGIRIGATLIPRDAALVKQAHVEIGYDLRSGFYLEGSITLRPSEELELEVGLRFDQERGLQVMGITPTDKAATDEEHEIASWKKRFPTIPLASIGVASLGLKFGLGVEAGYRMPRIKFKDPKLEGGLEALDRGGMPAITFGGQIAMGAYISMSLSVQVVGEIQLLIASCDAGIGAEIAARLNLELGADVNGRFAPGQGALLMIDPYVGASLDLIASLIATLHAEICWFTIVDKKWTLASANFAHIELGQFHPFHPVALQIGGPGGTHLVSGLSLRDDAFDQITEGVKEGGKHAGDEEANRDARERVVPVLKAFKAAAHHFKQLPPDWKERGITAECVDFHAMFPVQENHWDYYQDHADTAEQIAPEYACVTPEEKLAKAVAVTARRNPFVAGMLIVGYWESLIAAQGYNPRTGVNVVEQREIVQAHIDARFEADLADVQRKEKEQQDEHVSHVKQQAADHHKAEATHARTAQQQKAAHDESVARTQGEWNRTQQQRVAAAQRAQQAGAQVQPARQETAPPPPTPPAPPAPRPLARPAPIPPPPPVPMPAPREVLPAVTLPALPADPGVNVRVAVAIPPAQKKVQPESPPVKTAPRGGSPDPTPGTTPSATQAGGGGGGSATIGGGTSGGARRASGGGVSAAPRLGPAVTAGPDGIIAQNKTLDAKDQQVLGGSPGAAAASGKPGMLGKLSSAPSAAMPPAAARPSVGAPGAPGAAGNAAPGSAGAASGPDARQGDRSNQHAGGLDPTVQKVVDQGKADQAAYKQKLAQQAQQYDARTTAQDKATKAETQQLDQQAAEASKRKEREKAGATNGQGQPAPAALDATNGQGQPGPDGTNVDKDKEKDKDKDRDKGEDIETPRALAETHKAVLHHPAPSLVAQARQTASGAVLYTNPSSDPKQVTRSILHGHPDARYDKGTGTLTLPPVHEGQFTGAASLEDLATQVAQATGVSRVVFHKHGAQWALDVQVNPTLASLVTIDAAAAGAARLQPLIDDIVAEQNRIYPQREVLLAICRDAANRHRANGLDVAVTYEEINTAGQRQRPNMATQVTFTEQNPPVPPAQVFQSVIATVSDGLCPACNAPATAPGARAITRPHNVISSAMWGEIIRSALNTYGIRLGDDGAGLLGMIIGAGTGTGGDAVTEDRQCPLCEANQNFGNPPHSLIQRQAAADRGWVITTARPGARAWDAAPPTPGDLYVGQQYANMTEGQQLELLRLKIEQVVDSIRRIAEAPRDPAGAPDRRPANHRFYARVVDAGQLEAFLDEIRQVAEQRATAGRARRTGPV